jgi:site-specific DNA-methyltransferase (adenine-specific)
LIGSEEGDTVLDPFMGSGTTGVVAKQLNRNFIGIEIDSAYFKIAKDRIENTHTKSNLNDYLKNLQQTKTQQEFYAGSTR